METSIVLNPQVLDMCLNFQVRNRLMDCDTVRRIMSLKLSVKTKSHHWFFLALIQIPVLNDISEMPGVRRHNFLLVVTFTQWNHQMPKMR